jgi:uncharacterized protein (TIGR02391 family)
MSIPPKPPEPPDSHLHAIELKVDTVKIYVKSLGFVGELLKRDIEALDSDPDLKTLLDEEQRRTFEIDGVQRKVRRTKEYLEQKLGEQSADEWEFLVEISHGRVRLIRSCAELYLKHLRIRRDLLAARPNISRHALRAVDQRLAQLEEKLSIGIFGAASHIDLLADEVLDQPPPSVPTPSGEVSIADRSSPRPVVVDSIEILDAEVRARCLDLFAQFQEDGQPERLDTVVTEATRILEHRLRRMTGAPPECVGVELATFAFGGADPKLKVSDVKAEQEAAHLLARGTFGFIRNRVHHKLVPDLSAERVIQIIAMIDYLIFVADSASRPSGS